MSRVEPASTLGGLVTDRPARAELFERLRLDYCCGGPQTLAEACDKRGLELDIVLAALETSDADAHDTAGPEDRDWREASIGELCAHIVAIHHDGLRDAFPRIETLLATVARVHGAGHPELRDLQHAFGELRAELEPHLESEEEVLFPACEAFERDGEPIEEALLAEHEQEHATVGDALAALRVLGDGYDPRFALCNTHRTLLDALAAFERDLHQHVHEENNILIPRVRRLGLRVAATPGRTAAAVISLPRCCQAWIVEQARGWASGRS